MTIRRWLRLITTMILTTGFLVVGLHATAQASTVLTVEATPNFAGEPAAYHLWGSIAAGDQVAGVDSIRIEFKWDTTVTGAVNPPAGSVLINGEAAPSARWTIYPSPTDSHGATRSVALTAQLPRSGMLTSDVDILLTQQAGIINPSLERPCYTAFVWLLKHGVEVGYLSSNQYTIARSRVQNVSLSCTPAIIGQKASYELSFVTGVTGAMQTGVDYFRVAFQGQVSVPSTGAADCIDINGVSCKGKVFRDAASSSALLLYTPVDISPSELVTITFCNAYGLVNPIREGLVSCSVSSSIETQAVTSNQVAIGGLNVRDTSVVLSDPSAGASTAMTLSFTTSALGRLPAGSHIMLDLSAAYASASLAPSGTAILNNQPASFVAAGSLVTIDVPADVSAGGSVTLTLPREAGLVNPLVQGPVSIGIRTTSDTTVATAKGTVTPPAVTGADATFSTLAIGGHASLQVRFVTSAAGALSAGQDTITITFAPSFILASDFQAGSMTVNGVAATQYAVQNSNQLQIVVPAAIGPGSPVTVHIAAQAALQNPASPGSVSLGIMTSKDLTPVDVGPMKFREAMSVACSIDPAAPNGHNGWYVGTAPAITFDAGAGRTVLFRFDAQPYALYSGVPVVALEGTHTLSYYGVDADGVAWEPVQRDIRVDTVKPTVMLDGMDGIHGAVDGFIELTGHVSEPLEVLQFNSIPATVNEDLSFSVRLPVAQQSGMLGGYARDLAGNVATSISNLRIDTTAPRITMLSPVELNPTVSSDSIHIQCSIDELGKVTIGGNPAVFDGNVWTADVALQEGANSIVVEACDDVGNMSRVVLAVTYRRNSDIILTIGKTTAAMGDHTMDMGVAPVISGSSTMVPLRFVSEALGARVNWEPSLQIATITLGKRVIQLQIGSSIAMVDSSVTALTAAPILLQGHTLVPLRFVSETLGANVTWNGALQTVTIVLAQQASS